MCGFCMMWELVDPRVLPSDHVCSKCRLLEELQLKVDELASELQTLRLIRGREGAPRLAKSKGPGQKEAAGRRKGGEERRPQPLNLHNRFEVLASSLEEDEAREVGEQTAHGTVMQQDIGKEKGKRNVVVIGDSGVKGIDTVLCHNDKVHRRVCCLPGARVQDVAAGLQRNLEWESEDPVVVVHVGAGDVGKMRTEDLGREYEKLGMELKSRTDKVVISGLLPEPSADGRRVDRIKEVNGWLRDWCGRNGFEFMGHWHQYWGRWDLFGQDGVGLNHAGTRVLANRVKRTVDRALN